MKTERLVALLLIIGLVMFLSGCANLKFAWSASYQTDNLAGDLEQVRTNALTRAKDVQREQSALTIAR